MDIVHLTLREGMSSVYMAQVVKPMSVLREKGWDVSLLVFAPVGEMTRRPLRSRWNERRGVIEGRGLRVTRLPSPPSRLRNLWSEAPILRRWLRRNFGRNPEVILHCRGHAATLLGLSARERMPSLKVLFDCRGVNGEEYAYVRGYAGIEEAPEAVALEARRIEQAERYAAREADHMICISHAMKDLVRERWGIAEDRISVVPCCTDTAAAAKAREKREEVRRRLCLNDRLVVAYCGSLERWQVPETCLAWFNRIARIREDAHLLAITTHPDKMVRFAQDAGIPESRRTVVSVPQDEVAEYLSAADCGLLIREPSVVNRVASPVKFAEYLSVGVPVLVSEGVGDCSDWVREHGLGAVVDEPSGMLSTNDCRSVVDQIQQVSRGSCQEFARQRLDWGVHVEREYSFVDCPVDFRTESGGQQGYR